MSRIPPEWFLTLKPDGNHVESKADFKSWLKWQACIPSSEEQNFGLFYLSDQSTKFRRSAGEEAMAQFPPQGDLSGLDRSIMTRLDNFLGDFAGFKYFVIYVAGFYMVGDESSIVDNAAF